ncbi:MAG: DUF962 domain-containing protein [Planctomycetota bacterium]|nr:DUF962 domain-containing protein [Planctomycetota bacterium]
MPEPTSRQSAGPTPSQPIQSFRAFYPYYMSQHQDATTRLLHVVGTVLFIALVVFAIITARPLLVLAGVFVAYFFAWIGHVAFERNRPATFRYPLYSVLADFRMSAEILTGSRRLRERMPAGPDDNRPAPE